MCYDFNSTSLPASTLSFRWDDVSKSQDQDAIATVVTRLRSSGLNHVLDKTAADGRAGVLSAGECPDITVPPNALAVKIWREDRDKAQKLDKELNKDFVQALGV